MSPAARATHGHACVVLGIGLRAQADAATLQDLWRQAQAEGARPFCAVALLEAKAAHPALARWLQAAAPEAAVVAVPAADLPGQPVQTRSARLQARYGTGSVAEAAALAAAGPQAQLLVPRRVAGDGSATLAVALRRPGPLHACLAARAPCTAATPNEGATA